MNFGEKLDMFFAKYRYEYFGIIGCAIIATCTFITTLSFTGNNGEPYSIFNHFISELGTIESQWAWIFNLGLIVGVPFFFLFLIGTRTIVQSRLASIGRVFGGVAGIGGFLVGIFPGNPATLVEHLVAGSLFFLGGGLVVVTLSAAIFRQKESRVERWVSGVGFTIAGIFLAFLIVTVDTQGSTDTITMLLVYVTHPRPVFYASAFFEWSVLIGILIWVLLAALASIKYSQKENIKK
ncbi:MAG TPA: DUF998 domain-containing protein [Candidatus Lokiarchaeia archaeon]|nr:DUF998 domain-containing protein [Candidatus Lokiarchaeia archaeon]